MLTAARIKADHLRLRVTRHTEYGLYQKYKGFSMINRRQFVENLELVRSVRVHGDIVECGTWEGGMSAAMAEALPGRHSVLFDSFAGLPEAAEVDGKRAHEFMADGDRLAARQERAEAAMQLSGQDYEIVPGWFDTTVPSWSQQARPIAVLRLDGDWYDSTIIPLQHLFPLMPPGSLLIEDDYGNYDGSTRALHDFLSTEKRVEPIERGRYGTTYMRKRFGG